ncbi:aminotransferase class I/II-fold pyridoxal phosphate-dependent enzyme [Xylophilus rhododendri]|uniref:alanine transaminase n=1 Tax=Xylophilus rhododendri TaxID=2697032 RepID=A0A857JE10_9BURK|nr:pyridoxal phosphate-dependent aminotransferase [Xylophilus rhododendri]QHJ01350.1 aminotransferase class I/II-fold pyridoxal phosphate-dependent enzyme [Xylophilus rhododendri]
MKKILKSAKLANVLYDIRGPIVETADEMAKNGRQIVRLNMGNLAEHGFEVSEKIRMRMIASMHNAAAYSDGKGLLPARLAVLQAASEDGIARIAVENIYLGNGASELISMALTALLDDGDELLIPMPDFPLWPAATALAGGTPVHYRCNEEAQWAPDIDDIRRKISARTKGIVVINPNNPTGALYSAETLLQIIEVARIHGLVLLADEVCRKILYDHARHIPLASLSTDVLTLTFDSLSKNDCAAGYRAGWLLVSGPTEMAEDFLRGLNVLANMKLCSNVQGQWAIEAALNGGQALARHTAEGGRLKRQRDLAYALLSHMPGVSCVKPRAALYMFPRLDPEAYPIADDRIFFRDLLLETGVMVVQGSGFGWQGQDHFRMAFLPHEAELADALGRLARFLDSRRPDGYIR